MIPPGYGASYLGEDRCRFRVWAPRVAQVEVRLLGSPERIVPLHPEERGFHAATVEGIAPGDRYLLRLDGGRDRPDPASRLQPEGVHGPSEVVDPRAFRWEDSGWRGVPLEEAVFYELHVGTFTPEGTFDGVIPHLDRLLDLGITILELMPVAQFPGERNWGYDGTYPWAVQRSYGGPEGLKRLVAACHARGLGVALDVVYNHLGPEGNYLPELAPVFSGRYLTPWGQGINFDAEGSDEVRGFFLGSALRWIEEFHVDALRIDAIHGILDLSARPFLAELAEEVHRSADTLGRRVLVISESDLNDPRVLRSREAGGFGHDAQWNDDFHHALHTLLTGEREGYYRDFGTLDALRKAFAEGFVIAGEYSPYRRRRHGAPSNEIPSGRFVVFSQNHDQVGNRARGERLAALVPFESLKCAAGVVLLSPCVPLLFMGEEYGETAPFLYFVSHADPGLVEAVRRGRREEFAAFGWKGEIPDPQDPATFLRSRLDHGLAENGRHRLLREFYRELLRVRRSHPALAHPGREGMEMSVSEGERWLAVRRRSGGGEAFAVFHLGSRPASVTVPAGRAWRKRFDSAEERWGGPGGASCRDGAYVIPPQSFVLWL